MAKLRERISVNKLIRQNLYVEIFDLKKLDDIQVKEKYYIETSSGFAALDSEGEVLDINNAWELLEKTSRPQKKENVVYQKIKHNKSWFGEYSKLADQREQLKLQLLQNANKINRENLQNVNMKPIDYLGTRKLSI
jgi:hypothetical protein